MLVLRRLRNPDNGLSALKNKLDKHLPRTAHLQLTPAFRQRVSSKASCSLFDLYQTLSEGRRAKIQLLQRSNQDAENRRKEKSLSVLITVPHNNSYFAQRQGPPLSLLLFPRCVSWFMPASRRNSIPEDMISQHISDFRQHFPNHLFAVLLYPSIPFCYTLGHHELPAFFRRYL